MLIFTKPLEEEEEEEESKREREGSDDKSHLALFCCLLAVHSFSSSNISFFLCYAVFLSDTRYEMREKQDTRCHKHMFI